MATRRAFTLVELLVVVIVLAILAAMVLPGFSSVTNCAKANMLMDNLRIMRLQLVVYKSQHADVPAGYPGGDTSQAPTDTAFEQQLTLPTNIRGQAGDVGDAGHPFGPYMREIPENPVNGRTSVLILGDAAQVPNSPPDTHGWVYQPATMTLKADCPGTDDKGKAYFDY